MTIALREGTVADCAARHSWCKRWSFLRQPAGSAWTKETTRNRGHAFVISVLSRTLRFVFSSLTLAIFTASYSLAAPEHPGLKVYRDMCAECHGAKGEGVAGKHDEPLVGGKSLPSLIKYIERAMPEDKEGTCVGPDAQNVAAYIFDAFYSPAAQARNKPVHENLSRLTVEQYQNSVTDLIGRFRPGFDRAPGKNRGLRGRYQGYPPQLITVENLKNLNTDELRKKKGNRINFDRVDPRISFQYGTESPEPDRLDAEEFQVRWDGSFMAPETGYYEFIVRTENGFRLSVNNPTQPLIDSWVTPGPKVREERKGIFLLGGRSYPINLEYFKFRDRSASIELRWKPPHGREQIIPEERLEPQGIRESFVLATTFPADDRSDGYERGTSISEEWDEATTAAALEVAAYIDANLDGLTGTKVGQPQRAERIKTGAKAFVEAAFRRPLNEAQQKQFIDDPLSQAATPELGLKRIVLFALKSPRFLYPELAHEGGVDDFTIAARLALQLWDSIPDPRLAKVAAEGKLRTADQVANEARLMIADPRTKAKFRGFFHHWLDLDRAETASKDPKAFPGFDQAMLADLRESLWLFLDEVVWSPASDYRQLISDEHVWLNDRLGKYYGKPVAGEKFERVSFDPAQRSGVITHPYLLTALSYARTTSPVHRGVFLSRNVVGLSLRNPSVAVAFEDAKFDPTLTMREKVADLTKAASCQGCHSHINPLGFSLEHFDAVGRWRTKDNNKPVNAVAEFETDDGRVVKLTGPKDVANYALTSESAHRAFIREVFHHVVKQPVAAYGNDAMELLRRRFAANQFNIQKLVADVVTLAATAGSTTAAPPIRPELNHHPPCP